MFSLYCIWHSKRVPIDKFCHLYVYLTHRIWYVVTRDEYMLVTVLASRGWWKPGLWYCMKSHPLVWDIEFIRLRRGTNARSIDVASNSCRKPTVIKGQGIEYTPIVEMCQKIWNGDLLENIPCLVSGKPACVNFWCSAVPIRVVPRVAFECSSPPRHVFGAGFLFAY